MRQELYCRSVVMASALAASLASAQDNSRMNEGDGVPSKNRFGLNYRMGFNISASFKNLGGYPALGNSGRTPNGALWNYDNGYNLDDSPGTPPGQTWYWGYINASQVHDGNLYLSRSSANGDVASGAREDDPQQPGFELTYNRLIGKVGKGHWGLEGAFNYMNFSLHDNRTLLGNVTVQTDAYALNGVIPPQPPYFGTYEGPIPGGPNRPVISDTPIAQKPTFMPNGAVISGERKIDADLYGLRIGPYLDFPITKKITLGLSGGFAAVSVQSQFKFNETVSVPSVATTVPPAVPGGPPANSVTRVGAGSHSDFLFGGYVAGNFSYAFNKSWSALASAQFQDVGRFSQKLGGKQADLDLSESIFVTIGVGYSF